MSLYICPKSDPNYKFLKKFFYLLVLIILLLPILFSFYDRFSYPSNDFQKHKSRPLGKSPTLDNKEGEIHSIIKTQKGYLLTSENNHNLVSAFEIDEDGNELWEKKFSKYLFGGLTFGIEIKDAYIISYQYKNDEDILGKYYATTNIIDKTHHKTIAKIPYFFYSILECENGFIAIGEDNTIFRFNQNGKEIWRKEVLYDNPSKWFKPRVMKQFNRTGLVSERRLPDINFIKIIESFDGNYIAIAKSPFLIMKFDKNGKTLWKKDYTNDYGGRFIDILKMKDSSYLALAYIYSSKYNSGRNRAINVIKITNHGEIEWNKEIVSKRDLPFTWFIKAFDGDKYFINVSNLYKNQHNKQRFFIVDDNGNIKKQKDYFIEGNEEGMINAVETTNDGGILLGGKASYSEIKYFTIKEKTYETKERKELRTLYRLLPSGDLEIPSQK